MGQDVKNQTRFCQIPEFSKKGSNWHMKPRTRIMALSLTLILTTTGLVYIWWSKPLPIILIEDPVMLTPHAAIAIDGDADFSATALLEGWPGDGSPENPYIIGGLNIDLDNESGHCIMINNTRVSFTISNCNLTGANLASYLPEHGSWYLPWREPPPCVLNVGAGIHLYNVSNGELVNNTCNSNDIGIFLSKSSGNTVSDNTCNNNTACGTRLLRSDYNTVANNTCNNNTIGIYLYESGSEWVYEFGLGSNIVTNNTCSSNTECGIYLYESGSDIVTNNTCSSNTGCGIYLDYAFLNMLVNNTCNENGCSGISGGGRMEGRGSRNGPPDPTNIVEDNTCNENGYTGIHLTESEGSTVVNNTCNSNDIGTFLSKSSGNTVSDNTCNNNRIGIYIDDESESNIVANNTFSGNTEHDIVGEYITEEFDEEEEEELAHQEYMTEQFVWFLAGCGMILVVSVIAFVKFRRMGI